MIGTDQWTPASKSGELSLFLPRHFDARLCAPNFAQVLVAVFFRLRRLEGLFCFGQRLLRSFHVDFIGALHGFRENGDAIRKDFGEAPCRRETVHLSIGVIGDLSRAQLGDQGCMAGQYANIAISPRNLNFIDRVTDDQLLRSNNLELEVLSHSSLRRPPSTFPPLRSPHRWCPSCRM